MKLKHLIAVLFTALALALAIGACGGSGIPNGDDNTVTSLEDNTAQMSTAQSEQALSLGNDPTTNLPCCDNCDAILDRCFENGWKPTGLCNLCASGACYEPPCGGPF